MQVFRIGQGQLAERHVHGVIRCKVDVEVFDALHGEGCGINVDATIEIDSGILCHAVDDYIFRRS